MRSVEIGTFVDANNKLTMNNVIGLNDESFSSNSTLDTLNRVSWTV